MTEHADSTPPPFINVTPLIDVLLVMLIIFMVTAPLKLGRFETRMPAPPDGKVYPPNPKTLLVTIAADRTLKLNGLTDMGSVDDASKLCAKLVGVFHDRTQNHVYRDELASRLDVPEQSRIEKTVFINAPRSMSYGEVTKVIDAIKGAGASPIGLQLDNLQ
ncbi:MAG: biopolymer transporter ExbD [Pyrinomonadaceae bacterium]